jgi:hypothetical protein
MAEKRNFKIAIILTTEDDKLTARGEMRSEQAEFMMENGIDPFQKMISALYLEIRKEEYRIAHGFEMPAELYDK